MTGTSTDRATEEAAEWSVLLLDEPDDRNLRSRFEAWRRSSAENASAWSDMQRTAALASGVLPDYAQEWRPLVPGRSRLKVATRRWLAVGTAVVAAAVAWVAMPAVLLHLQADHMTDTAEVKTFRLQDGSAVTLGPESAVTVTLSTGERHVRLLKGEAFFEVAPDTARPFKVVARSVHATVLGTRFNVRLEQEGAAVAVEEGRVRVELSAKSETLEAGQAVELIAGRVARSSLEPGSVALWRQGMVYLRDRPLAQAIDQIRRYFPGRIVVADVALEQEPTTGVFHVADPEAALRGLAQAHGARVRAISPWLLVVSSF